MVNIGTRVTSRIGRYNLASPEDKSMNVCLHFSEHAAKELGKMMHSENLDADDCDPAGDCVIDVLEVLKPRVDRYWIYTGRAEFQRVYEYFQSEGVRLYETAAHAIAEERALRKRKREIERDLENAITRSRNALGDWQEYRSSRPAALAAQASQEDVK